MTIQLLHLLLLSKFCAKVRSSQGFSGSNARTDPAASKILAQRIPSGRSGRWSVHAYRWRRLLAGRSQWIALLCEALTRALLSELGLARILLGSSGGGQFLVVLPGEARQAAEDFLAAAARQVAELSSGLVKLIWP